MIAAGEIDAYLRRDPAVLWEDDFRNGPAGWVPLVASQYPDSGPIVLDSEITTNGSGYSLFLNTGDAAKDGVENSWGACHAIKRLYRGDQLGKVYMEWIWAYGSSYDDKAPRHVIFGLDECATNTNRHYFQARWQNWDNNTNTKRTQYQVMTASGWQDVPGAVFPHGLNENKRNLIRTEMVVDTVTGQYLGLRVNGNGYGALASTPTAGLGLAAEQVTLPTFEGGCNVVFGINNRNDSSSTHAWSNLAYSRGVRL